MLTSIDSSSVFLVSGGARGITARCVIRLAEQYRCRWILLGRSPVREEPSWAIGIEDAAELKKQIMQAIQAEGSKPTPKEIQRQFNAITSSREIRSTLQALQAAGSIAQYLSADVTDLPRLQAALAPAVAELGAITGIIHGAGNLADKLIENKTAEDFDNVYTAKVQGLENLLQCVPIAQLQHLVLFSSVAGFFGSAGQSDYALANEILNKSAHLIKQQHPGCHVVSINWGPWDSGMVTPLLKRAFESRGIHVIPIEVGTEMLVRELRPRYQDQAQVVIGSPILPPPAKLEGPLRQYRIQRQLSVTDNPFLADHAIGPNPVLPATCAAAWMIYSCEQLYPGYRFAHLEEFKVLKGIVFDGTQSDRYTVDVQESSKVDSDAITFEVRVWSENEKGKIRFHYSSQVTLQQQVYAVSAPPPPVLPATGIDGRSFYADRTLFHGPCFQGVEQVFNITNSGLTMRCVMPKVTPEQQGQFFINTFNPFAADVLIQSVLIWLRKMHGVSALPAEIAQISQFQPISPGQAFHIQLEIQQKNPTTVISHITAYTESGEVCIRLSGVRYTISDRLLDLFSQMPMAALSR